MRPRPPCPDEFCTTHTQVCVLLISAPPTNTTVLCLDCAIRYMRLARDRGEVLTVEFSTEEDHDAYESPPIYQERADAILEDPDAEPETQPE